MSLDAGRHPDRADAETGAMDAEGSFTIAIQPEAGITVIRGSSVHVTVLVARMGEGTGKVDVSASGLPRGVTASSLSLDEDATMGTLTLTASSTAVLTVSAALKVTGTYGSLTDTASVPLFVEDAGGTLDETFGDGGVALVPLQADGGVIGSQGLAVQPDGKVVFCGNANPTGGSPNLVVGRLTANGAPDPGFGENGLHYEEFRNHTGDFCMALQLLPGSDGATRGVALGGFFQSNNAGDPHGFLAALVDQDGLLDPSFGNGDGFVSILLSGADGGVVDSKAYDLVVQAGGSWILAGDALQGSGGPSVHVPTFLRLTSDGGLDDAFGEAGVAQGTPEATVATRIALVPNGNGTLVAAISSPAFLATEVGSTGSFGLISYGDAGFASASPPASLTSGSLGFTGTTGLVMQAEDGALVLAGPAVDGIELVRFDREGNLDTSFGTNGFVHEQVPMASGESVALARTRDGGFAASSNTQNGSSTLTQSTLGILSYDAAGRPDTSFGIDHDGSAQLSMSGAITRTALAIDPVGRIVVGAFVNPAGGSSSTNSTIVIARFWP
jgi:uncharacterized delta-60 repeat protein